MTTISASIKGKARFSILTHNEELIRVDAKLYGEQRISDEAKLNAALKPMDAKRSTF